MPQATHDWHKELQKLRVKHKLIRRTNCTEEENQAYKAMRIKGQRLPDHVRERLDPGDIPSGIYYTEESLDLSAEERMEYIELLQLSKLNTIKNCALFFAAIAAVCIGGFLLMELFGLISSLI